jgi:hypothetical protein
MKSEDFYIAAFLAVLPVCLSHYHRFSTSEGNHSLLQSAVNEAHDCAVIAREKFLSEKEKTRRRGGYPE